jgi:2-phosphosulfolactate phosphatase
MDVCFSPEMVTAHSLKRKTVVVADILRASSSITAGIQGGVPAIRPVDQIHRRHYWQERGYLLGGERGGVIIDGFDLGNAPLDYLKAGTKKQKIIMTTTNGTRAIQVSKQADQLLVGSFLNLDAIAGYLLNDRPPLLIVCSGWQGTPSLEDSLFAGALLEKLGPDYSSPVSDGARLAITNYRYHKDRLLEAVHESSHGQRLLGMNREEDIDYCLQRSIYPVVPILRGEEIVAFTS